MDVRYRPWVVILSEHRHEGGQAVEKVIRSAAVLPPSSYAAARLLGKCRLRDVIVEARMLTVATHAIK